MGIAANELCQYVIRPTLVYLNRHCASAEACYWALPPASRRSGPPCMTDAGTAFTALANTVTRRSDDYLARDPDLASLVRGLASQHAFLGGPHLELTVNLRYSTAIAWMLIEEQATPLPAADDLLALARIWRQIFHPQGRLRDFTHAWQTCIDQRLRQVS